MKTTTITAFGQEVELVAKKRFYADGTLAIQVDEILPDEEQEPFGTLTVNMGDIRQSQTRAFVKDYSENQEWARQFIEKSGIGKPVDGAYASSGFVSVQLFEFDVENI